MPPVHYPHYPQTSSSWRNRSPYLQRSKVHLHEDSDGNIFGVEYLAGSSGYDTDDDCQPQDLRKDSHGSASCCTLRPRTKISDLRQSSSTITQQRLSHDGRRRRSSQSATSTVTSDPAASVRLCPSPGRRPSASFTLSSPETSGKDDSTDSGSDDIPELSLPQPSIRKSPLLNKDLFKFVSDAGEGGRGKGELDLDLEPMIFAMSLSEDSDYGDMRGRVRFAHDSRGSRDQAENEASCSAKRTSRKDSSGRLDAQAEIAARGAGKQETRTPVSSV